MKKLIFALVMTMVFAFVSMSFAFTTSSQTYRYGGNGIFGNDSAFVDDISIHQDITGNNKNRVEHVRQNVVDNSTVTTHKDFSYSSNTYDKAYSTTSNRHINAIIGNNGDVSSSIHNFGNGNTNTIKVNRTNVIDNSVRNEYIRKK